MFSNKSMCPEPVNAPSSTHSRLNLLASRFRNCVGRKVDVEILLGKAVNRGLSLLCSRHFQLE